MTADRERALVEAFGELAEHLLGEHDVGDLLTGLLERCVDLFPVDAAGLLLRDGEGRLGLAATSSEEARTLEFFQLEAHEGACVEAYRTRGRVLVDDLEQEVDRWPDWAPRALDLGFHAVTSLPLVLRDQALGALNLFAREPHHLHAADLDVAQALARVATVGIVQHRQLHDARTLADQLQRALTSRVVIEQAKGVLAERNGVGLEQAFEMMRTRSRHEGRKLSLLAREVVAPEATTEPTTQRQESSS